MNAKKTTSLARSLLIILLAVAVTALPLPRAFAQVKPGNAPLKIPLYAPIVQQAEKHILKELRKYHQEKGEPLSGEEEEELLPLIRNFVTSGLPAMILEDLYGIRGEEVPPKDELARPQVETAVNIAMSNETILAIYIDFFVALLHHHDFVTAEGILRNFPAPGAPWDQRFGWDGTYDLFDRFNGRDRWPGRVPFGLSPTDPGRVNPPSLSLIDKSQHVMWSGWSNQQKAAALRGAETTLDYAGGGLAVAGAGMAVTGVGAPAGVPVAVGGAVTWIGGKICGWRANYYQGLADEDRRRAEQEEQERRSRIVNPPIIPLESAKQEDKEEVWIDVDNVESADEEGETEGTLVFPPFKITCDCGLEECEECGGSSNGSESEAGEFTPRTDDDGHGSDRPPPSWIPHPLIKAFEKLMSIPEQLGVHREEGPEMDISEEAETEREKLLPPREKPRGNPTTLWGVFQRIFEIWFDDPRPPKDVHYAPGGGQ